MALTAPATIEFPAPHAVVLPNEGLTPETHRPLMVPKLSLDLYANSLKLKPWSSPVPPIPLQPRHSSTTGKFTQHTLTVPLLPPAINMFRRNLRIPQKNEARCCQMIIPGLYVAFEHDSVSFGETRKEELRTSDNKPFTHTIRLAVLGSSCSPIETSFDQETLAQILHLNLPRLYPSEAPSPEVPLSQLDIAEQLTGNSHPEGAEALRAVLFDNPEGDGISVLDMSQLSAAHQFIQASGFKTRGHSLVRLLITAPRNHRTDAISVVLCWLKHASGWTARHMVQWINSRPPSDFLSIWQGTVTLEGADYVEAAPSI